MGFPTSNIVSGGSQVDEFVCAVCCQLAEDPVYTTCTHVFCKQCLEAWLPQRSTCPKCNTRIQSHEVLPLKTGCPLAWRLLGRLRCRCPLYGQSCSWEGDYSELGPHLTSNDTHLADAKGAAAAASADTLNDQANQRYTQGAYRDAIKLYSKAITLAPETARYLGNRAAAWLMVGAYQESISDCKEAVRLDPKYVKGHVRLARALCELGEFERATAALAAGLQLEPESEELIKEHQQTEHVRMMLAQSQSACVRGEYALACALVADIMTPAIRSPPVVVLCAANAHLGLGDVDHALRLSLGVLKQDSTHAEAFKLSSRALYLKGDFEQAMKHIKQLLKLNPDDSEAASIFKRMRTVNESMTTARKASFQRDFETAIAKFSEALDMDPSLQVEIPSEFQGDLKRLKVVHKPLSAELYAERASAYLRMQRYEECLMDSQKALLSEDDHKTANLAFVSVLQAMERFEEAEQHLKMLLQTDPNNTLWQERHRKVEFEVRKRRRPDYYKVLGVQRVASVPEIKAAYKQRAMEWHPDKHDSEDVKKRAEEQFKLIGEALSILTDDMKRSLYDEGYDQEAIEERVQAANRAAREDPKSRNRGSGGGCCGSGGGCG